MLMQHNQLHINTVYGLKYIPFKFSRYTLNASLLNMSNDKMMYSE